MTVADQHWNPDRYRNNAGFVATLGMPVVDLLAPKEGERILDLGCGDGALTHKLVELGCVVTGRNIVNTRFAGEVHHRLRYLAT